MPRNRQTISNLLSRKSTTVVPKDQESLHEHPDSWIADRGNRSSDWAPVPNHVIRSSAEAFIRAKKTQDSGVQPQSSFPGARAAERNASHSSPSPSGSPSHDLPPIPSGVNLRGAKNNPSQVSIVNETPRRPPGMGPPPKPSLIELTTSESTHHQGLDVLIPDSHESATSPVSTRARSRPAINYDFPSSSVEEDLEMAVPQAQEVQSQPHSQQQRNFNSSSSSSSQLRASYGLGTPPCAQPPQLVLPSSLADAQLPTPMPVVKPGKRRLMKPIQFDESMHSRPVVEASKDPQRMAATKTYSSTETISSNSAASSSIVPATFDQSPQIHTAPPRRRPSPHRAHPYHGMPETQNIEATAIRNQQPEQRTSAKKRRVSVESPSAVETIESSRKTLSPYELFTTTYPSYVSDYSGNLWSFIRACLCLEYLRKTNSLRDFLYDEFIREFSNKYLEYVESSSNPISAFEWFNSQNGPPEFSNMVVQNTTLDIIMASYPDKIAEAKGYIKNHGTTDSDAPSTTQQAPKPVSTSIVLTEADPTPPHRQSAKSAKHVPSTTSRSTSAESQQGNGSAALDTLGSTKRKIVFDDNTNTSKRFRQSLGTVTPRVSDSRPSVSSTLVASTPGVTRRASSVRSSSMGKAVASPGWKYGGLQRTPAQEAERSQRLQEYLRKSQVKRTSSINGNAAKGL